jgi:hypothetical protein
MKKLFTITAVLCTFLYNAQTIQLTHKYSGQVVPDNGSIYLDSYADSTVEYELMMKNTGNASDNVSIKRTDDMLNSTGSGTAATYFCTGETCYTPDVMTAAVTLAAGQSLSFKAYLAETSTKGESVIRYRFTSSGTDMTIYFKFNNVLGVVENSSAFLKTLVFPNPSAGPASLMIDAAYNSEAAIRVTDVRGATVWSSASVNLSAGVNIVSIPSEELAAGLYFLSVSAENHNSTQKFVISK